MNGHVNLDQIIRQAILSTQIGNASIEDCVRTLLHNNNVFSDKISALEAEKISLADELVSVKKQINLLFSVAKGQNSTKI